MNKTELIKAVAEISGAKQTETGVFFENLIEVIESTVASGEDINITGFGKFSRKEVKGREGVCKIPTANGKTWKTEDSYGVSFKAGKEFKDKVKR
jgi:DNA-binding protein HU-beta